MILILFTTAVELGCSSFQASDWKAAIILPASGDCYRFAVMSGTEDRFAADSEKCIAIKQRGIILDSENYLLLRRDILKNCQFYQCTQIVGAFDDLFLTLDRAARRIPAN